MSPLPSDPPRSFTGSCLCGAIRFHVDGPLAPVQVCHCRQCRQAQGGPFATNIPVARSAFHFERGQSLLKAYESTPGKRRHFCLHCGSPVFSERDAAPEVVRVRAGLLDGPLNVGLAFHAFVESGCDWWPLDGDAAPRHPAWGPSSSGTPPTPPQA